MGTKATTEGAPCSDWPRSHARARFPKACMNDARLLRAKTHHPIRLPLVDTRSPLGEREGLVPRRSHERLVRLHLVLLRARRRGRCSGRVFPSQRLGNLRHFHGEKFPQLGPCRLGRIQVVIPRCRAQDIQHFLLGVLPGQDTMD